MLGERLDELDLPLMVAANTDPYRTAFTVSVDARAGTTTGISAADRATTIQALIDPATRPADLARPGHIFPLRYREGGVLKRAGHTEAAVDLARLAGRTPAAVLCEIVDDRRRRWPGCPELERFAAEHGLPLISIADLIRYRRQHEKLVKRVAEARIPTRWGDFTAYAYESLLDGEQHLALVKGRGPGRGRTCSCGSTPSASPATSSARLRCDCGPQLEDAHGRASPTRASGWSSTCAATRAAASASATSCAPTASRSRAATPSTPTSTSACRSTAASTASAPRSWSTSASPPCGCSPTTRPSTAAWRASASRSSSGCRSRPAPTPRTSATSAPSASAWATCWSCRVDGGTTVTRWRQGLRRGSTSTAGGRRVAIAASRFNRLVTDPLVAGAVDGAAPPRGRRGRRRPGLGAGRVRAAAGRRAAGRHRALRRRGGPRGGGPRRHPPLRPRRRPGRRRAGRGQPGPPACRWPSGCSPATPWSRRSTGPAARPATRAPRPRHRAGDGRPAGSDRQAAD